MTTKKYAGRQFLATLVAVLIVLSAQNIFAGARIGLPSDVYYHRFASSVSGPEASWINPAALAIDRDLYLQYIGVYFEGDFSNDRGTIVTGDGVGIAYRRIEDYMGSKYSEYIFGGGIPIGNKTYCGASYRYVKNGFDYYNKRHFWNIGLLYEYNPRFAFGVTLSNLNRGEIKGEKSDMEQLYSASYKTYSNKIILSVEMTLSSKQSLSSAKYNYGIDFHIQPGLVIYANRNNDQFYQIGFTLNFGDYFAGSQSRIDSDNNHLGTSAYGGFIKELSGH